MLSKSDRNISLSVREYLLRGSASFISSSYKDCLGDFFSLTTSSSSSSSSLSLLLSVVKDFVGFPVEAFYLFSCTFFVSVAKSEVSSLKSSSYLSSMCFFMNSSISSESAELSCEEALVFFTWFFLLSELAYEGEGWGFFPYYLEVPKSSFK